MELRQDTQEESISPSPAIVESSAQPVTTETPPVEQIVKELSNRNKDIRAGAEKQLAALGPESTDELLRVLEIEGQKYRRHRRNTRKGLYIGGGILVLYLSGGIILGLTTGHWDMMTNLGSFGVFGGAGAAAALTPQHKSIVKVISELDDMRSVGWLADTLDTQDKEIMTTAEDTLTRLLPQLQREDAAYLDNERRRMLDRKLVKTDRADFALAILLTYERLGDSRSLASVEIVESGRAVLKQSEIVHAAQAAAAALRVRQALEHEVQTLLRPSSTPVEEAEILLRPAGGATHEPESALLRPAMTDTDD